MELLTFIGSSAKRQSDFIDRAQRLAESFPSLDELEEEMENRAAALTRKLKNEKITFSEFQRVSAEDTLVSSLAALMLGLNETEVPSNLYSETMGQMKFLWNFFDDIKLSLDKNRISEEENFAEDDDDWYYPVPGRDEPLPITEERDDISIPTVSVPNSLVIPVGSNMTNAAITAVKTTEEENEKKEKGVKVDSEKQVEKVKPRKTRRGPATWNGVESRLKRFLVTPLYRWKTTGEFDKKKKVGMREMRRISKHDKRVCQDCAYYDSLGWAPIGSLPMPGVRCRCHDRCRCGIAYR